MDKKIVLDALQGKESAFALIYEQTVEKAHREALRIVKNEHDAWDVVQDAYIKMWQSLDSLQDPSKLESWFASIVRHKALDFLDSKEVKHSVTFSDIEANAEEEDFDYGAMQSTNYREFIPEEKVDYQETQRILWGLVNELPDKQRECMLLRWRENMKIKEISEVTGYPEATVKSCLNYGRKKMEEALKKLEKEGTKLYGITPLFFLPFLRWMLGGESTVTATASAAKAAVEIGTATTTTATVGAGASSTASASATSAVAGTATSGAVKAGLGLTIKQVIAGVCVAAAIGTGAMVIMSGDDESKLPTVSIVETGAYESEITEYTGESIEESTVSLETTEKEILSIADFVGTYKEDSYTGEYNDLSCALPMFLIDSADAIKVNDEIISRWGDYFDEIAQLKENGESTQEDGDRKRIERRKVYYTAWRTDIAVTICIIDERGNWEPEYKFFSILIETGEMIDDAYVMQTLGMSYEQLTEHVAQCRVELSQSKNEGEELGKIARELALNLFKWPERLGYRDYYYAEDGSLMLYSENLMMDYESYRDTLHSLKIG